MADTEMGGFWTLIFPRFGTIFDGGVVAVAPVLVLIIWAVAAFACVYAFREARKAKKWTGEALGIVQGVAPAALWERRSEINVAAKSCSEPVYDAWREFDETLVVEGRRLYNTVNAAEFFNEQKFAPKLVGNRFLAAAPTALTTLGLLGTFLGLTVGLRDLDLGSTSDQLRTGIQTLVDGAALGFTASLWGVAMSLVTNVYERWQEHQVTKQIHALQARIDELFRMKSPEQSLSDIAAHTGESKEALQVLHEKIGSALQESVRHVGEETSRAVNEAIHQSLTPIMVELAQKAADQSADVFKDVSAALTSSFEDMGLTLAEQLKASSESMRSTLDYMSEQLARQADQHLEQMNAMQEAAATHLLAVSTATERQLGLLDQALPKVIGSLEDAAALVGSATAGMEAVSSELGGIITQLDGTSTTLTRMLAEAVNSMAVLGNKASTAAAALASQQDAVSELTDKALAAADLLHIASGSLNTGFDGMQAAQQRFLEDLARGLGKHTQDMAGSFASYAAEVEKQTAHRLGEWNVQTERFTSTMLNATQALSDAVDELGARGVADATAAAV
jgi:hypothetical protein